MIIIAPHGSYQPTFENFYHFHTTVVHFGLHAIILHDDHSLNERLSAVIPSVQIKHLLLSSAFGWKLRRFQTVNQLSGMS